MIFLRNLRLKHFRCFLYKILSVYAPPCKRARLLFHQQRSILLCHLPKCYCTRITKGLALNYAIEVSCMAAPLHCSLHAQKTGNITICVNSQYGIYRVQQVETCSLVQTSLTFLVPLKYATKECRSKIHRYIWQKHLSAPGAFPCSLFFARVWAPPV